MNQHLHTGAAGLLSIVITAVALLGPSEPSSAAQLKQARVTHIVREVNILPTQAAPRPAQLNDEVRDDTAVRTGGESRTELTFTDQTIARLGANTIFSFDEGSRNMDLRGGAMLLRVPKDAGGAKITTAAVTAAITGTTVMLEYNPDAYVKFIVLEGTARIFLRGVLGESVLVSAGQMLMLRVNPKPKSLPDPVDIDLGRILATSLLIRGFPPLGSETLMATNVRQQAEQKAEGTLIDTNLVIFGGGTLVTLADPTSLDAIDQKPDFTPTPTPQSTPTPSTPTPPPPTPTATVAPTPGKFGTPPVIPSPVPYVITTGTAIETDPTVTTNGITDFGKIYRGPGDDGPFSSWAFTATSSFDTASGIDPHFAAASNLQISAFKFESLRLDGNPSISTDNGGTTKMALISVGDMTSGATGATFTFTPLDTVLLATQAGSIRLSGIGFQGIDQLYFYARGATSDLILGATLTDIDAAILQAERDVQVNAPAGVDALAVFAGNDFLTGTGPITATDILIVDALRNVNFTSSQFPYGTSATHSLVLRAGNLMNIDVTGDRSVFANARSVDVSGNTINFIGAATNPLLFAATSPVTFTAGAGGILGEASALEHNGRLLNLFSGGEIRLRQVIGANTIRAATSYRSVANTDTVSLEAGTSIFTGGNLFATAFATAGSTINVSGQLFAPQVTAGGNVTADRVTVQNLNAPNGVLTAGSGGITPFVTSPAASTLQHTFNIASAVAPSGIGFNGSRFGTLSTAGGRLTINANTLTFGDGGIAFADFSGANGTTGGGGSGGVFIANTTGALTVNGPITATTGTNNPGVFTGGAGGTVMLRTTGGLLSVGSSIIVSSNDPDPDVPNPPPVRRSASGGLLSLSSGLTTGTAINLGADAQLLGDLSGSAAGLGSEISITTAGGDILIDGQVQARRGRITIAHAAGTGGAGSDIIIGQGRVIGENITMNSADALTIGSQGVQLDIRGVTLDFRAANNLTWSAGASFETAQESSGNVTLFAGNTLAIFDDLRLDRFAGNASSTINLTLDGRSAVSVGGLLRLATDNGSRRVDNGMNILVQSGGAVTAGDISARASSAGGSTGIGANITFDATGNISSTGLPDGSGGNIRLTVANSSGQIGTGGNITLRTGGSLSTRTGGRLDLLVDNTGFYDPDTESPADGGQIGTGGNISVTAASLSAGTINAIIDNTNGGMITSGGMLTFNIAGNLTTSQNARFLFYDRILNTSPVFAANAVVALAAPNSAIDVRSVNGSITVGGTLDAYFDNTGNEALGATGPTTVAAGQNITVTGRLNVRGDVIAGGLVRAGTLSSTNVSAATIQALTGGIRRFSYGQRDLDVLHTLTAAQITSQGGINFSGREFMDNAGALTINAGSIDFGTGIAGTINFNGGQNGGNGGTLDVTTSGALNVNSVIEATTGNVGDGPPTGFGGTVNLTSTNDTVSVASRIEVSSTPPPNQSPTPASARRSARGGNISVTSNRSATAGASPRPLAINIANTGQLLSLLDGAAPGPGGKITVRATGTNTDVRVAGTVRADRGTVDIRHEGAGGRVNLDAANVRGDVVKVATLGSSGEVNIGNNAGITADTALRLYAEGSNGTINFLSNVTLQSPNAIIAANTVNITDGTVVTINGANRARVFTNNPNYSPINGGTNGNEGAGRFIGTAAPTVASPFADRPPLDGG